MKFFCDNCKAKYQIGDDKIAGKVVRMKCRRCGYDIHVSGNVAEGARPPEATSESGSDVWDMPSSAPPPVVAAASAGAKGQDDPSGSDDENTAIMTSPIRAMVGAKA